MTISYIVFLLIGFLVILYLNLYLFSNNEKFTICEDIPSGPYLTNCVISKFNNNELSAYCKNVNFDNEYYQTKLKMDQCPNNDSCYSVKLDDNNKLTC